MRSPKKHLNYSCLSDKKREEFCRREDTAIYFVEQPHLWSKQWGVS